MKRPYTYKHATVGGTFDRLHAGHRAMLSEAFRIAERVTVAVTSDTFPRNKRYAQTITPYTERVADISRFLNDRGLVKRARIIPIDDPFGPAPFDSSMDSIVVTRETSLTAQHINELRKNAALAPLHIHTIPYVKGTDARIVRSTRIRQGEVNRDGYPYGALFREHRTLTLPESLRSVLRKPMGMIIEGSDDTRDRTAAETVRTVRDLHPPHVITVGDIVHETLKRAGLSADIAIIDHRNNRQDITRSFTAGTTRTNMAGTLMPRAIAIVKKAFHTLGRSGGITITIRGEEDLLALPAILFAPLGTLVIYGQYQTGIVVVQVTEEIKEAVREMVEQFR